MSTEGFPASLAETWEPIDALGEGAMGRVYRCRHRTEGYQAAVKVALCPDDVAQATRMVREAETLVKVRHPGVVQVHAGGRTPEGETYLAMELLEGDPLEELFPMAMPEPILIQVAQAIHAVHQAGLVHRDVKPSNILVTRENRAVLVDFGLVHDPSRTQITATGHLAGTPAYLAPELLRGRKPRAASDWYAFGVTAFQALEDAYPYGWEEIQQMLSGEVPPEPAFSRLPEGDSRRVLLRGLLWPDPGARYRDPAVVEAALDHRREVPKLVLPERPSRTVMLSRLSSESASLPGALEAEPARRLSLMAPFLVVFGLLVGGLLWPSGEPPPPAPAPATSTASVPAVIADLGEVTMVRREAMVVAMEALRQRHPEEVRLFSVSWSSHEIPGWIKRHAVEEARGGKGVQLVENSERLASTFGAWSTQLRDWAREGDGVRDPLKDPRVRDLVLDQLAPLVAHLGEDHSIRWSASVDPSSMDTLASVSTGEVSRRADLLNVFKELRFSLEEWGWPPPRPLLALAPFLPEAKERPVGGSEEMLAALAAGFEDSREARESWLLGRGLLHVLSFAPWLKDIPWTARRDALERLRAGLGARGSPLPARDRELLRGRALLEAVRLLRAVDLPDDHAALLTWIEEEFRTLLARSATDPEYAYSLICQLYFVGRWAEGPFYGRKDGQRPLPRLIREILDAEFWKLRRRYGQTKRRPDPDFRLSREVR